MPHSGGKPFRREPLWAKLWFLCIFFETDTCVAGLYEAVWEIYRVTKSSDMDGNYSG